MRHTVFFIAFILFIILTVYPSTGISADENIVILKYSLKPVEYDESGSYVKTKWNLFIMNEAERPVRFIVRIYFIDRFNNGLEQFNKRYEINPNELRRYSDSVVISEFMARRTVSTEVSVDEMDEESK
jgi:hypothetical protein